jgi:hypothetical protein
MVEISDFFYGKFSAQKPGKPREMTRLADLATCLSHTFLAIFFLALYLQYG